MKVITEGARMLVSLTTTAMLLMLVTIAGCNSEPRADAPLRESERGVNIEAPGVDIEVKKDADGDRDVDIRAPGVDIGVEKETD